MTISRTCGLVFAALLSVTASAQIKEKEIALQPGEEILRFIDLADRGFLIKTGKEVSNAKHQGIKLRHYTPGLDLTWEVALDRMSPNDLFFDPLVVNPHDSSVYNIESLVDWGKTSLFITQVTSNGSTKTAQFKEILRRGGLTSNSLKFNIHTVIFCTREYLFLMVYSGDKPLNDYSVSQDAPWTLLRIKHSDLSLKEIHLDLPGVSAPLFWFKSPSQLAYSANDMWNFAGADSSCFYLYRSCASVKSPLNMVRIFKFSTEGSIIDSVGLNFDIQKYPRPSHSVSLNNGTREARYTSNFDYNAASARKAYYNIPVEFTSVELINNKFYATGLTGDSAFREEESPYNGYFVASFNTDGSPLSITSQPVSENLLSDKQFSSKAYLADRNIGLRVYADTLTEFSIWGNKRVSTYTIANNTAATNTDFTFATGVSALHVPLCSPQLNPSVRKCLDVKKCFTGDDGRCFASIASKSFIVVSHNFKSNKIKLIYFKR